MNSARKLFFFIALCFASLVSAKDYHNALEAQDRGDYASAAQAWTVLANAGDPVAQYNLALLYQNGQGVKSDVTTAQHWLTLAARQGLTQAYKQLNSNSVKPSVSTQKLVNSATNNSVTTNSLSKARIEPHRWVMALKPEYYTIQLVSSTNEDIVKEYFQDSSLTGKAGYYHSYRQGQIWYSLVYGEFLTVAESNAALTTLPENLKKWSPWIRKISEIQRIAR